ncbi:MAG: hypothetical protein OXC15_12815 [Rhodospirillaceae bacterium]|nr:hypothetical protein [Rhodospirillaceae bacterium]
MRKIWAGFAGIKRDKQDVVHARKIVRAEVMGLHGRGGCARTLKSRTLVHALSGDRLALALHGVIVAQRSCAVHRIMVPGGRS